MDTNKEKEILPQVCGNCQDGNHEKCFWGKCTCSHERETAQAGGSSVSVQNSTLPHHQESWEREFNKKIGALYNSKGNALMNRKVKSFIRQLLSQAKEKYLAEGRDSMLAFADDAYKKGRAEGGRGAIEKFKDDLKTLQERLATPLTRT